MGDSHTPRACVVTTMRDDVSISLPADPVADQSVRVQSLEEKEEVEGRVTGAVVSFFLR